MVIGTETDPRTISVRVEASDDRIVTVEVTVKERALAQEISIGGTVVGFIEKAGRVYVALRGQRWDRAEECAASVLWDHAVARLVERSPARNLHNHEAGSPVASTT
jgi:hypothetical protein